VLLPVLTDLDDCWAMTAATATIATAAAAADAPAMIGTLDDAGDVVVCATVVLPAAVTTHLD